jgi:hypothetical protein
LEGFGIAHSKGLKFSLFSGEEKTVLAWLNGLGLTDFECLASKFSEEERSMGNKHIKTPNCLDGVEFGSNLLFELFIQSKQYYVNMRYNGKVLNICGTEDKNSVQDCKLDDFTEWMKDTFMLDNYTEFCGNGEANVPDTVALKQDLAFYSFFKFVMMCCCIGMVFLTGFVWFCMGRRNKY